MQSLACTLKIQTTADIVQSRMSFLSASAAAQTVLINLTRTIPMHFGYDTACKLSQFHLWAMTRKWLSGRSALWWWLFLLSDDGYWICYFADCHDIWKYGEVALIFDYRMNFARKWLDLAQRERMLHHRHVCRDLIWFPIRLESWKILLEYALL